jgi:hypothetical protein
MEKIVLKPINIIDNNALPEMSVEKVPTDGDPMEINGEMYYVCENPCRQKSSLAEIGVIPLVVRNPSAVTDIKSYIHCLSLAHRKVLFRNASGICDLENCDEMIIS